MKTKYKLFTVLAAFALTFSSCDFLDVDPNSEISPNDYYKTEQHMEYAITGVYDILGKSHLYAYGLVTRMASEADEGFYASTAITNGIQFYNMNPSTADVATLWNQLYDGINRANIVLANIDNPEMSDDRRKEIKGEALFLRAFYYFWLITHWGDVPVKLDPTTELTKLEYDRASTPMADIYEMITADMEMAEKLVPDINQLGYSGRVSKSAVRSILARVYLYWAGYPLNNTEKYEDVKTWTELVINDNISNHKLNSSYSDVFVNMAQDKYDIKESIWEVEFSSGAVGTTEMGQIGSWIGITTNNTDIGSAYGFIATQPRLFKSYEDGDLRRDRVVANFMYDAADNDNIRFHSSTVTYGRKVGKWRRSEETALPKLSQFTPINFPIIRYSDVLLMHAEALNEISQGTDAPQEAINDVNEVRRRAWSTGIKTITITNEGSGYTSVPTIEFADRGGFGIGAEATATIKDGKLTAITLTKDEVTGYKMGENYTDPVILIVGGGGTGATATATVHKKTDAEISSMTKDGFREFIKAERSRELCFEGLRKYDLMRWNILIEVLKDVKSEIERSAPANYKYAALSYTNAEEKHYKLPYPAAELALNKKLRQNTGY